MSTTRQRILDTAEVCFAKNGFDGCSLREITSLADVNLGAVNYHFGSKVELFTEVLRRRVEPMNRRRLELLDLAIARHDPEPPPLEEILYAFLRPAIEAFDTPARGTLLGLQKALTMSNGSPGFLRNDDGYGSTNPYPWYDSQEWVVIDLRMAVAYYDMAVDRIAMDFVRAVEEDEEDEEDGSASASASE